MRKPEIAREITSCWICPVPSQMSWVRFGLVHRFLLAPIYVL